MEACNNAPCSTSTHAYSPLYTCGDAKTVVGSEEHRFNPELTSIIEVCVTGALEVLVKRHQTLDCYGCVTDHPSQTQHPCLYDPEELFYTNNVGILMAQLWNPRFVPSIACILEARGFKADSRLIKDIIEDILTYDLRDDLVNIMQKIRWIQESATHVLGLELKQRIVHDIVTVYDIHEAIVGIDQ